MKRVYGAHISALKAVAPFSWPFNYFCSFSLMSFTHREWRRGIDDDDLNFRDDFIFGNVSLLFSQNYSAARRSTLSSFGWTGLQFYEHGRGRTLIERTPNGQTFLDIIKIGLICTESDNSTPIDHYKFYIQKQEFIIFRGKYGTLVRLLTRMILI